MVVITDLSPCDLHGVMWYYIQCDKYNGGDLEQLKTIHRLYIYLAFVLFFFPQVYPGMILLR